MMNEMFSPTRTYVAICWDANFTGNYVKKFIVPEQYTNDRETAQWYFTNELDREACVDLTMSFENYANITEVKQ